MNGDEDLGLDMIVGGTKVHVLQHPNLPQCDGSNGVAGVDCLNSGHYPRKLDGTPFAPAGPPVGALAQGLPACDGSNGVVGVDCVHYSGYPRKLSGTPYAPAGPPVLALNQNGSYYAYNKDPTGNWGYDPRFSLTDGDLGENFIRGSPPHILHDPAPSPRILPQCDDANGMVGFHCQYSGHYPRKYDGTPFAPAGPPLNAA